MSLGEIVPGTKFGQWTFIEEVEPVKYAQATVRRGRFLCSCGRLLERIIYNIIKGISTRCYRCSRLSMKPYRRNGESLEAVPKKRERKGLPYGEASFNALLLKYKLQAKKRNLEWMLSDEHFRMLTQLPCFYCLRDPEQLIGKRTSNGHYVYNGIDRWFNGVGYTLDNVVACCGVCNDMKGTMDGPKFVEHLREIAGNTTLFDRDVLHVIEHYGQENGLVDSERNYVSAV